MLKGYKTYGIAVIAIGYAVFGFLSGHIDGNTAIQMIEIALGMGTLRAGITNEVSKVA